MEKKTKLFLLIIVSIGFIFANPNIYSQAAEKLDIFYTNNVEGYLEPCG